MSPLSFTQALEHAAMLATQALPESLHERLACAVVLVRDGHCFQTDDGTWTVQSTTDPAQTYTHVNGACPCEDVHYNHPDRGLCKHRLAVYLSRKTQALMTVAQTGAPEPTPAVIGFETKNSPLYEAAASVNVHLVIDGRDCLVTLRDHHEGRLLQRLAAVLAQYPAPQPVVATAISQGQDGYCAVHSVPMKWNDGKEGRKGWWSHRVPDGSWCKGR
jgi:hypothetical protein